MPNLMREIMFVRAVVQIKLHVKTDTLNHLLVKQSGIAFPTQPLDRDEPNGRAYWLLWVVVTDGSHYAATKLRVNVKDVNDNAPVFLDSPVTATVRENAPAGEPAYQEEIISSTL